MKKVTLAIMMALLLGVTSDASAVIVDGINSAGEWTAGLLVNGFDINEGAIPDGYDISRVAMQSDASGLYVLVELYGAPTFTSLDVLPPIDPVFYTTGLDIDGNGLFTDAVDRIFDFRASGFTVYDGSGAVVGGAPLAVMGSAVEYFIPAGMFSSFPLGGFNTFTLLDNAGAPPDDRVPDSGFHTTIPEPTSMLLVGSGLLGALGLRRRKR